MGIIMGFQKKNIIVRPLLRLWNVCDSFEDVIKSGTPYLVPEINLVSGMVNGVVNDFLEMNEVLWTNESETGKVKKLLAGTVGKHNPLDPQPLTE